MFIKHRAMRDVCMKVTDFKETDAYVYFKGCWVNIANKSPFFIGNRRGLCIEEFTVDRAVFEASWFRAKECFVYYA